ncbi:D-ribose pyranase [Tatumella ptyseos]|uniref:D-ribose pyranase n=1 Tax=Tatumella ptyseos TaxID=82987 RepID=UPI0026ECA832|nr:D-ribose pyranase [Tatumella ptyseos]WKX26505.1 D-ribose pyranase [Tatumella ptyseos]
MNKGHLLHPDIAHLVTQLGHFETLTIADAGLPIPSGLPRIELALTQGVPSFRQVSEVVANAMQIQAAHIADEIVEHNPQAHQQLLALIERVSVEQGQPIEIFYLSHEQFKSLTHQSRAVIRTGECTPYANVIFTAGVTF